MGIWYNIATTIFQWKGFNSDFIGVQIERQLFNQGTVCFFIDSDDHVEKALPWVVNGKLNIYGRPVEWNAYGVGFNKTGLDADNSVIIWNNSAQIPTQPYIRTIVNKMVNIDGAIDVNVNSIKTPSIFTGDERELLTFKNMFQRISDNEPVIYTDKSATMQPFNVLTTGAEYYGEELSSLYDYYEGRLLTYLGLKYIKSDKKERLVVDEANSRNDMQKSIFFGQMKYRQEAAEKINEIFGLDVSVDINEELKEDEMDNKSLHNNSAGTD